jgi:hypothetical protein
VPFLPDGVLEHLRKVSSSAAQPPPTETGVSMPRHLLAGRFLIERVLASGGMATVYRARDVRDDRVVAVKVPHEGGEELDARFVREAGVLAGVHDPSVVGYVDHGVASAGTPYLAMELLEGETLAERLERGRPDVGEALAVVGSLAAALAPLHDRGLVHRDVKPDNVFLCRDGEVKLLDLGLARAADTPALTARGYAVGTPGYMAPEQMWAAPDLDARADVFALGCLLYRCLAGRLPFEGAERLRLAHALGAHRPPPLLPRHDWPRGLERLVLELLASDRAKRPANARAVLERLGGLGTAASPVSWRIGASAAPRPELRERLASTLEQHGAAVLLGSPAVTEAAAAAVLTAELEAAEAAVAWIDRAEVHRRRSVACGCIEALVGLRGGERSDERRAALAARAKALGVAAGAELEEDDLARGSAAVERLLVAEGTLRRVVLVVADAGQEDARGLGMLGALVRQGTLAVVALVSTRDDASRVSSLLGAPVLESGQEAGDAAADARLSSLGPTGAWVMRAAALLGPLFWTAGLASLLPLDARELGAALTKLVAGGLIVDWALCAGGPPGTLRFADAGLYEAARARWSRAERTLGPALARAWLEKAGLL